MQSIITNRFTEPILGVLMELVIKPEIQRLTGGYARALIPHRKILPFSQITPLVERERVVIASNMNSGKPLVENGKQIIMKELFPCWYGAAAAYAKPGEKTSQYVDLFI